MKHLSAKFVVILVAVIVAAGLGSMKLGALDALKQAVGTTWSDPQTQGTLRDLFGTGRDVLSNGSKVIADAATTIAGQGDQTSQVRGSELGFDVSQVKDTLGGLQVRADDRGDDYNREGQFGPAWQDVDGNGCDTRNDILARDLTAVRKDGKCTVVSGHLEDPYTARGIDYQRGRATSSAVQIDHLVPLKNAWQSGARNLSQERRVQLANDPLNLLAVDGPTNQAKSDKDAGEWLPANAAFQCQYVERQVLVKAKYGLWVTNSERDAMAGVLDRCQQ
ncbi:MULTISPECIES: HNH endonuclease family protein [unclassified Pseudoclavibacter]|uniref:HNH endonuclease family protein n=1 Tax=unclassified Pseudoclavibacter TaxID=2615177 RepID=UPI001CE42816|nr:MULTISPECIES: HNH endonuclease family protein [unclassified Pseudoclavibacter]MCD7100568.1 HNH endonuclease family protein [Pseudoclavibacter sp. 13-3]